VYVQKAIRKAIADTEHNSGLVVTVAFDYGSRAELVRATKRAMTAGTVNADSISENLYDPSMPSVDLLVRTSGESRISNFMLWQITGSKVFFTERTWPDFDADELDLALAAYATGVTS
jgi:undecaprenyl diphosphate synthase